MGKTLSLALGLFSLLLLTIGVHCSGEAAVKFSYRGATGPENWSSLSPEYRSCSSGQAQSPINIVSADLWLNKKLTRLDRNYTSEVNATLYDHGVSVGVKMGTSAGVLVIDGRSYSLGQVHWHTPAEHTIDGVRWRDIFSNPSFVGARDLQCISIDGHDAELHMVHKTVDGAISVVAFLFKLGRPDPFIGHLEKWLKRLAMKAYGFHKEAEIPIGTIPIRSLTKYSHRSYHRYMGSLTTPPCSENVVWSIMTKVWEISGEQLALLKAPLDADCFDDFRPAQPLNGRKVELYEKTSYH